jgi:C4-dicarboxylate-specific signal transduction histidine kinase
LNRGVPLRDKRGKVVKWYGAATDIQDRKRAEQLQADLATHNRVSTMGELVASISHEHLCDGFSGIEAMKGAGGVLTVKTGRGEGGQVLISVSDTGVGLPDGGADEIFNAFFTTKPEGSGMGLAISRSIVESHDGHLWATSHDGRGATFHFTLPTAVVEVSSKRAVRSSSSNNLLP